jgi:hypothetical protein
VDRSGLVPPRTVDLQRIAFHAPYCREDPSRDQRARLPGSTYTITPAPDSGAALRPGMGDLPPSLLLCFADGEAGTEARGSGRRTTDVGKRAQVADLLSR